MSRSILEQFCYSHKFWDHKSRKRRHKLFKKVTKSSLPLFFNGQDNITVEPMANGAHEPEVKSLIDYLANSGYADYLIDIGANIGLSSCQSGKNFACVHMFEPNPNVLSILKINTKIMLRNRDYRIHEYGLGAEEAQLDLYVPFHNWGAAFVKSSENGYDEALLSAKDGYSEFDVENYEILKVDIKPAQQILEKLFSELRQNNRFKGVVKIDIEGMEQFVIESLLRAIPHDFHAFIIFENWKDDLRLSDFDIPSNLTVSAYSLVQDRILFPSLPRLVNSISTFLRGGYETKLSLVTENIKFGTCVLKVGDE